MVTRRTILIGMASASTIGGGILLSTRPKTVDIASQNWSDDTKSLLQDLSKGTPITMDQVHLDIAHFIENGAQAGFSVVMPDHDPASLESLTVIASQNPNPLSARFFFSSASGKIMVKSRLRLAVSQPVLALATMKDGRFFLDSKPTDVHIKGCTP